LQSSDAVGICYTEGDVYNTCQRAILKWFEASGDMSI